MKGLDEQITALNQAIRDINHELLRTTDAEIKAELENREDCYCSTVELLQGLKSIQPLVRLLVSPAATQPGGEG